MRRTHKYKWESRGPNSLGKGLKWKVVLNQQTRVGAEGSHELQAQNTIGHNW